MKNNGIRTFFTKKKEIVASVLDTEDNEVFPRPTGLSLSVEGKVKKLESIFSELIKKLDTGPSSSGGKFRVSDSQGPKRKAGCWNCGSLDHFSWDCPRKEE